MTHLLMNIIGCFVAQQKSSNNREDKMLSGFHCEINIAIAICYLEEAPVDSACRLDYWVL